jgi:hypothetical protein
MATTVRPFGSRSPAPSLARDLTECVRTFARALFDPYRPELHYMRGRGPKWHAKHAVASTKLARGGLAAMRCTRAPH